MNAQIPDLPQALDVAETANVPPVPERRRHGRRPAQPRNLALGNMASILTISSSANVLTDSCRREGENTRLKREERTREDLARQEAEAIEAERARLEQEEVEKQQREQQQQQRT
jgi:hypothetical protein